MIIRAGCRIPGFSFDARFSNCVSTSSRRQFFDRHQSYTMPVQSLAGFDWRMREQRLRRRCVRTARDLQHVETISFERHLLGPTSKRYRSQLATCSSVRFLSLPSTMPRFLHWMRFTPQDPRTHASCGSTGAFGSSSSSARYVFSHSEHSTRRR